MNEITTLKQLLKEERPAPFDALPDIDLYKDQVLTYMQRQQVLADSNDELTGAMINNYIKSGLLPRPTGKRYTKQHLAYLTAICQLKQLFCVADVDKLLKVQPDLSNTEEFYNRYTAALDKALADTADSLDGDLPKEKIAERVLELSLCAYADRLAAMQLLALLKEKEEEKA